MPEAATIVSQAAQAVAYAHSRGLVHRDIKPGNLLVTPEGHTKVTDLGLAWHVEDDDGSDTRTGRIAGTADYLAPEVIRAPEAVGPASDIYALGCTLYYAVTGKVPFPGGRTADKLRRHLEEVPINPRRFNPDLSDMFLDVLADMLEKDPARRIHTADAVVEALRPWTLSSVAVGTTHKPIVESRDSEPSGAPEGEPSGFEDTASDLDFADSPSQSSEAPSQTSQGTLRMASWREETVPFEDELEAELPGGQFADLPDRLPQSLLLVITAAVTVVIVVVLLMIFS
jgi:serine/threonine protein kinase